MWLTKKGLFNPGSGYKKREVFGPPFSCTQNYTYSRTALYQELDELCRLVEKYKHLAMV